MFFITRSSIKRLPALAVLVSLAAFVLLVVVGWSTASATLSDGDVVLGAGPASTGCTPGTDVNCESLMTKIDNSSGATAFKGETSGTGGTGVFGNNTTSGDGVRGSSSTGTGVEGTTGGPGDGVLGFSGSGLGVFGHSTTGTGVEGDASSGSATGVVASNGGNGGATALKATGTSRFAGKTFFSRSGTLTISSGTSEATKSPINLGSTSLVLATIQGNQAGVYVQGVTQVSGSTGSFTIHLNTSTTADLPVAWFVVN